MRKNEKCLYLFLILLIFHEKNEKDHKRDPKRALNVEHLLNINKEQYPYLETRFFYFES